MQRSTKAMIIGGAGVAIVMAGLGSAAAASGAGDHERPITGEAFDRASAVALDHLGEGRVTETEEGDEDSYYEVEVTLDDGREVDVQLDRDFAVVGAEPEAANEADD